MPLGGGTVKLIVIQWWLVVAVLIAWPLAASAAPLPAKKGRPESLHLWQLVATLDDGMMFMDQRSKLRSDDRLTRFWILQTIMDKVNGGEDYTKYRLINFTSDCNRGTLRGNKSTIYIKGQATDDGGSSRFEIVEPESVGEYIVQAACKNRLKYGSTAAVTSIKAAIAEADEHTRLNIDQEALASIEAVDDAAAIEIARTFHQTMSDGGMSGIANLVQKCYAVTSSAKSIQNIKALARCVTIDIVAYGLDTAFRREFKSKFSKEVPSVFYFDEARWTSRMKTFVARLQEADPYLTIEKLRGYSDEVNKYLLKLM